MPLHRLDQLMNAASADRDQIDAQRSAVRLIADHIRSIPPAQQRQMPALVNGLAASQLRLGDAAAIRETRAVWETVLPDAAIRAESHFHSFLAAVRRRDWSKALTAFDEAARLVPSVWSGHVLERELRDLVPRDAWSRVYEMADRIRKRGCP